MLLTVLIAALWTQPITPSVESSATAAPIGGSGAGIPDSGKQRETMISELQSVNAKLDSLIKLLEPLMTIVLGVIIGAIVISLFLPLIKLLEGLSK